MGFARKAALLPVTAVAAAVAWNTLRVRRNVTLPEAIAAPRIDTNGRAGRLSCYADGDGPPFILLHSINAAASAHEVAPMFEHLRRRYRVYAPDLPGFGFSDRSPRHYDIATYVDAVRDVLDLVEESHPAQPVHAAAVSLAAEFLARVAVERPQRFRSLTLVNPTGFSRAYHAPPASTGRSRNGDSSREIPGVAAVVTFPLWSQALYDALASRRSIRYFLRRTFGADDVDPALVDYAWKTAHQPGARHAPLAFLSGRLFSRDIPRVYQRLVLPVWVPHGTRGDFRDFSAAGWTLARNNWHLQPFDSGALVYFQRPAEFARALDRFLDAA